MPPFWVGFSKQRKKPGWRRSSNCAQNVFFQLSHRGETKKHPWDRILQFRFHGTILGGLIQAAEKAGLTKVVQLRSKRVFSTFPIGEKRKNTLGIEFYNFGFMPPFWVGFSKQRKKPGWRRSSNCVQNAFFQLSPSGRNEKTPLGSNFTISVSCHHFGWAFPSSGKSRVDEGRPIALKTSFFQLSPSGRNEKTPLGSNFTISVSWHHFGWAYPSSGKSRVDEGRPIAFKTRFFNFPHRGETKKHPWDRILQFRFHATILGGLIQAAEKAGLTKVVQLRSKRRFFNFPIGAKRKNTLGIEFYNFGFMAPFWVGLSKQRKKPGWRRSSNCVQTRFFNFPNLGETLGIEFYNFAPPLWVGFSKQRKKPGFEGRRISPKRVFSTFPIRAKRKNTLGIEFYNFGFMVLGGLIQAAEKAGLTNSSNCVRRFFNFPIQTKKTRLGSNFTISPGGLFQAAKKPGLRRSSNCVQNVFFQLSPSGAKRKNTLGIEFYNFGFMAPFWVGLSKQRKKPGWRRSSNCVQNAFFQLSPSGRNEKTPLGSNFTISVSCHHFGWAYPSSGKSRVDEGRPIAFKTRFFNFPHRGETKKHPWDRILQFRFHATILGGLIQAAEKAGLTKVVQFRSKRRFFNFPHRGETKKHPWDRILQFRFHGTILGGLIQAAEKAGLTKVVKLRSKRVFWILPIGEKRKNTLGIEFYNFGFLPPFWVGFSKQRKKPGSRRSSNCFQNAFFQISPSGRNEKTPLGSNFQFRFHATILGGLIQAAEKPGWRKSSNCVRNAFFQLSPSGRNEKTRLGSNFTSSVSCHHFGWAFPSSGKSRVDEGRPIAFKTSFLNFPHRGETKKHGWDRILQFRFHATILGGLFQAAEKAWLTKVVQLRSKRVFSTFPIGEKRKNTLGIEFYKFGFLPPFWVGFSKQRKKPGLRRSSNCTQNVFFQLSHSERNEKTPLGSNFTILVSWHHFGWAYPSSGKSRVDEGRPIAFETRFFNFPNLGETKKTRLGSNFKISVSCHHFGWAFPSSGKSRVHEGRRIAFKTRFFNFPIQSETKKHPWDRILQFRFHATILGGLFQAAEKAGFTKVVQLRSKRVFSTFPIGAKRKNSLGIEFYNFGFMPPFWVGYSKQRKKPGWRRSSKCFQNAFFRLSPSEQNAETPLESILPISISYHHFEWAFASSAKSRVGESRPIAFKTRFFDFPHLGETKKHPWVRIPGGRFHTPIFAKLYQAAENAGLTKVVQLCSKLVLSSFPIGAKRKNTLVIEFHEVGFIPPFWVGFSKRRKTPVWPRSSNWVENSFCRVSPSGRNKKTPLGSNSTRSVSYHHFGWDFPSSAKRRFDQGRPIGLKTRFVEFPHRDGTKKHPWDQIPRGRFHTTILGGLFPAAQNAGLTKVVQLRSKLVFSTIPIGAKRKNTLGIDFHEVGFIPPFWGGFTK